MRFTYEIEKECDHCKKKATHNTILSYGLFGNYILVGSFCNDHAKKLKKGEYKIGLNGRLDFFEDD